MEEGMERLFMQSAFAVLRAASSEYFALFSLYFPKEERL
jgi:hypothetical protein